MFNTLDEITKQLEIGEDVRAEFKEIELTERGVRSPNTEDLAGELVAFANAEGGVIFIGVDDDGIVRGIPMDRAGVVERWVINVATNNCDPPIRPILRKERLTDPSESQQLVVLVEVRRGLYVHGTSGGRHYVRVGSTKQLVTGPTLARLFQERGRVFVFDEQLVPSTTSEDLDFARIDSLLATGATIPRSDLLRNMRVTVTGEDDVDRPTVSGLLAFGRLPQTYMPSARIECAVYHGLQLTSDELVHSESINGPVDLQIESARAFVERFMLKPARKHPGRQDLPQYDLGAVHEGIVNAVAHRDYSISGSKIRLFLYADRLEIYSPGSLPNTITIETMPYRVFTRNQLLVSFLSRMRSQRTGFAFLESRGEGVRRILEASEAHSGRKPVYELFDDELRLTIWASSAPRLDTN